MSSSQMPGHTGDDVFLWVTQLVVPGMAEIIACQSGRCASRALESCTESFTASQNSTHSVQVLLANLPAQLSSTRWESYSIQYHHHHLPDVSADYDRVWYMQVDKTFGNYSQAFLLQIRNWRQGLVTSPMVKSGKYDGVSVFLIVHLFLCVSKLLSVVLFHCLLPCFFINISLKS